MKTEIVICDLCGEDFTHSNEKGGLLFNSTAVCPRCESEFRKTIAMYKEESYIRGEAKNETFCNFVKRVRLVRSTGVPFSFN